MSANLKQLSQQEDRFLGGHTLCPGCPEGTIMKAVLKATTDPVVVISSTGCFEVSTTAFPHTSWQVPWLHVAFPGAAAVASGVERAYKFLKKQGKMKKHVKIVVFAGDGGTYDIGLQALSGMLERGHQVVYVCLDNEAYMNTGIQRSSSTPPYARTKTSEVGLKLQGKLEPKKDIIAIVMAHNIPYAAQTTFYHWADLLTKAEKAFNTKGPSYLNVLSPCVLGWEYEPEQGIEIAKLAVETCIWPLFEVENGSYKLNYQPQDKKPLEDYLVLQGRFKHLLKPENKKALAGLKTIVDQKWQELLKRVGK